MTPAPDYVPAHGLLAGKSVLITAAAGGGIGNATARRVLEEGARALMIADIHERRLGEAVDRLRADFPDAAIAGQLANVTVEDEVQALIDAAEAHATASTCWSTTPASVAAAWWST